MLGYFNFISTTDAGTSTFASNTNYTLTRTLSHSYKNVQFIRACLSTYSTNSTYFGFDVIASAMNEPATSINITLSIALNSSFTQIGFNIILVCDGFNSVVNFVAYNMSIHNTYYNKSTLIPLNNDHATFFEGMYIVRLQ